jgi:hypothetical protein
MLSWLSAKWTRGGEFRPYNVGCSKDQRATLDQRCRQVAADLEKLGLTNSFGLYRRLVDGLNDNRRVVVRPLKTLLEPVPAGKMVIGLRHDVDDDILTGLRAARHLARVGIPGSFYLLHVSHYYGRFERGKFLRHPGMTDYLRDLVVAGCEVGLHVDALGVYERYGTDGAAAVETELGWLREQGARVEGTAAHNSAPVYGAENFEVFRGRSLNARCELTMGTRQIPLQSLREDKLGLTYEANYPVLCEEPDPDALSEFLTMPPTDAIRTRSWLQSYFVDNPVYQPGYDASVWLLGRDKWVIACHTRPRELIWPANLERVFEFLGECPDGARVVFNIHPEYVSAEG